MALIRIQVLVFLMMTLVSFVCCNMSNNLREVVPSLRHNLVEETSDDGYQDVDNHFQAYPSYFNILENGKFRGFIEQKTDVITLESVSTSQKASVKKVSVIKYGAKGDGDHDDTEVTISPCFCAYFLGRIGLLIYFLLCHILCF